MKTESSEIFLSDLPEGRKELMCEPNLEFILDVIVDSPLESPSWILLESSISLMASFVFEHFMGFYITCIVDLYNATILSKILKTWRK